MHRDAAAGGNVPTHSGEALVGFSRGLDAISPYRIENWAMVPACHLGPDRLWALRERVRQVAESGEVRGLVITHGTDTIEETAYLLDRTLDPKVPVAITGAMRTSSDEDWDGPGNLLAAATLMPLPLRMRRQSGEWRMAAWSTRRASGEAGKRGSGHSTCADCRRWWLWFRW